MRVLQDFFIFSVLSDLYSDIIFKKTFERTDIGIKDNYVICES